VFCRKPKVSEGLPVEAEAEPRRGDSRRHAGGGQKSEGAFNSLDYPRLCTLLTGKVVRSF
jgi:hypothetical protein